MLYLHDAPRQRHTNHDEYAINETIGLVWFKLCRLELEFARWNEVPYIVANWRRVSNEPIELIVSDLSFYLLWLLSPSVDFNALVKVVV